MPNVVVKAKGLYKSFGSYVAVNRISFQATAGECLGILGPNGAGKTTTMRMLMGIALPDEGELTVLNYSMPNEARLMRQLLGVVPQLDNLDPDFTVVENLFTYASYFGLSKKAIEKRVEELLVFAALEHKAQSKVTALSGGMKRRLILARALINNPELLLLDEPSTGLDPQARQLIWQRLRSLKGQGTTLILTTHYMDEAERLCDRLLIMESGRILAEGKPRELIQRHIEPHVFEVHGETLDAWYDQYRANTKQRLERVGETIFCYCHDEFDVLDSIKQWPALHYLHRPANLEDVFIRLTGRELREDA
jgi:lipooligosaccharide transport system ATP-binding protein